MNRKAFHIYYSTFENESRILKETKSLISHQIVDKIVVLAKWREGLAEEETFGPGQIVYRIKSHLNSRLSEVPVLKKIFQVIKRIDIFLKHVSLIAKEKPVYVNIHQVRLLPLVPFVRLVSSGTTLIYDAHELETETNGLYGRKKKLFKLFEKWFIRSFKLVIVVGPEIEKWYRKEYQISNVVSVMNCPVYQTVARKDHFREEFDIPATAKIFLYQGALFYGRGVEVMLTAFAKLNDPAYTLVLMGYGEMVDEIKAAAGKYANIHYKPAVHPSVVLEYTSSADVGISLIENVCLSYYYCLPNKIFEYLMAGIPCIVSNMKEMSSYVTKNGTGIVCEDTTAEALIDAIRAMEHFDYKGFRERIGSIKKEYCWANQEAIMIDAYKKLDNSK